MSSHSGVNVAGILGERRGGHRSLGWRRRGVRCEEGVLHFTHFKMAYFVNSGWYFCRYHNQKNIEFSPEVIIWWTFKMHFWEAVNTLSKL